MPPGSIRSHARTDSSELRGTSGSRCPTLRALTTETTLSVAVSASAQTGKVVSSLPVPAKISMRYPSGSTIVRSQVRAYSAERWIVRSPLAERTPTGGVRVFAAIVAVTHP